MVTQSEDEPAANEVVHGVGEDLPTLFVALGDEDRQADLDAEEADPASNGLLGAFSTMPVEGLTPRRADATDDAACNDRVEFTADGHRLTL